jgi:hypothetical protein
MHYASTGKNPSKHTIETGVVIDINPSDPKQPISRNQPSSKQELIEEEQNNDKTRETQPPSNEDNLPHRCNISQSECSKHEYKYTPKLKITHLIYGFIF